MVTQTSRKNSTPHPVPLPGRGGEGEPTAREQFLAANPKAREVQEANIAEFNDLHEKVGGAINQIAELEIDVINKMRRAGDAINRIADGLPGKQITFDFHLQLSGTGAGQIHAEFTTIEKYQFVARALKADITTVSEAQKFKQIMLSIIGVESKRPPQTLHAPSNPLSEFKERFNFSSLQDIWKNLRSDADYCPDGRLRQDLRDTVRVELEPTFKLVDEIRRELEL